MTSLPRSKPCPCSSGRRYGDCCAPFHRREARVPDPSALVRARYSAFALGEVDFLYDTLHLDHPDRQKHGEADSKLALRAASQQLKFTGLVLYDATATSAASIASSTTPLPDHDGVARVLYLARVFRKGTNVSFVERAEFMLDEGEWKYLRGDVVDASVGTGRFEGVTLASFDERKG